MSRILDRGQGNDLNKYKFSVLMSVYSKENPKYFKEALDSTLVNQILKPDEFILVVDGPVGNEIDKVIYEYENKNKNIFKVYRLENNVGLGKALNYGIDKCSYDLIARVDSDDINDPNRFKIQIDKFKEDSSIDVIGSFIDEFEDNYKNPINNKKMPLSHNEIFIMAKMRNPINHMSVMFKKQTILNAGGYKHLLYLEDYFLWLRVLINGGKFSNIDKYLVHARVGNGMLERRSNKVYIKSWKSLSDYMINNNIINRFEYIKNIIGIHLFIYMPISLKRAAYKYILRN